MQLTVNGQYLFELALKWRTGNISDAELKTLNDWYYPLENAFLEFPDEISLDKLEKRLHDQFYKPQPRDESVLPPWDSLKRNLNRNT